jgi:hypothetical protein
MTTLDFFRARLDAMIDLRHPLAEAKNILREKWDWAMPEELLRKSFCVAESGA